jgi:hypothetical protein
MSSRSFEYRSNCRHLFLLRVHNPSPRPLSTVDSDRCFHVPFFLTWRRVNLVEIEIHALCQLIISELPSQPPSTPEITVCRHSSTLVFIFRLCFKRMTDSVAPQSVSTQGAYSPPIQRAISLGNKEYALKNYEKAVEHYGQASELQYSLSQDFLPDYVGLKNPVTMILMSYSCTERHYSK